LYRSTLSSRWLRFLSAPVQGVLNAPRMCLNVSAVFEGKESDGLDIQEDIGDYLAALWQPRLLTLNSS